MAKKLIIRRNGKYYQAGYYENCRWVNIAHLGTAERIVAWHNLVRLLKKQKTGTYQLSERTKTIKIFKHKN